MSRRVTQFRVFGTYNIDRVKEAGVCNMAGVTHHHEGRDPDSGVWFLLLEADPSMEKEIAKEITKAGVELFAVMHVEYFPLECQGNQGNQHV